MASVTLKIVVDKEKKKVLFAEAEKDFVDFILHIIALPLGAVARILSNTSISGSIGTLREGFKDLDDKYTESHAKEYLLSVKTPFRGRQAYSVLPEASCSDLTKFYHFSPESPTSSCKVYIGKKRSCFSREIDLVGTPIEVAAVRGDEEGYVKGSVTFMVMDDLKVQNMTSDSVFSLMKEFSIKDIIGDIEKREVTFGKDEAMKLLKASFTSKTVLTDVFLAATVKKE